MSISEAAPHRGSPGDLCCPRCGKPVRQQAAFCSSCGERLDKKKALSSLVQDEQDITNRYRITSLVRRRPNVNLYFAHDNQQSRQGQQRIVAIRDIDINSLHDEARTQAIELAQQEYDLLRLWRLPHVMPVVELRYFQRHLFVVSGYPQVASNPSTTGKSENTKASIGKIHRLYTLQDFLQSGQGLPLEQQALKWIAYLCQALDGLHRHQIIIGELDPYTIILNENSDNAEPALMISWLPSQLQRLLRSSQVSTKFWSYFCAPEALQGNAELRSDIYSLGAVLYLLLTGSQPDERVLRTRERLRSPRELNGRISAHVNDCVMQALSIDVSKRFQSALEMSEALFNPRFSRQQTLQPGRRDNVVVHSPVASDEDVETLRIVPLSQEHVDRWRASRPQTNTPRQIPHRPHIPQATSQPREFEAIQAEWQLPPVAPLQSQQMSATPTIDANINEQSITPAVQFDKQETTDIHAQNETATTWFEQLQRLLLGQQQRSIMAAALIETPMRVKPNQVFTLRLHILGRDESTHPHDTQEGDRSTWLSSLVRGETLSIEVRAVLNQNDTFVLQHATIVIPATGYVTEVTIPIQPHSSVPGGRRDRLHIFFFDKQRHPLYDKPFVVEVFVSHLVKRGQEGYNVLTIPS